MTKSALRKQYLGIRKRILPDERAVASRAVAAHLFSVPYWVKAKSVCVYRATPTEVATAEILAEARHDGKRIIYPSENAHADVFIIPGVVFDKKGWRLGRGAGFYDRLLRGKHVPKIGLCFEKQLVAKVPHFSYDVPMTRVITERGMYGETEAS